MKPWDNLLRHAILKLVQRLIELLNVNKQKSRSVWYQRKSPDCYKCVISFALPSNTSRKMLSRSLPPVVTLTGDQVIKTQKNSEVKKPSRILVYFDKSRKKLLLLLLFYFKSLNQRICFDYCCFSVTEYKSLSACWSVISEPVQSDQKKDLTVYRCCFFSCHMFESLWRLERKNSDIFFSLMKWNKTCSVTSIDKLEFINLLLFRGSSFWRRCFFCRRKFPVWVWIKTGSEWS